MAEAPMILLVDDDADIRGTLGEILEAEGYTVATAANGAEALDALRGGSPARLILLDLMMPVMCGWQFLAERGNDAALAAIPVAVLSAGNDFQRSLDGYRIAASLPKPIDLDVLLATVRSCTRQLALETR